MHLDTLPDSAGALLFTNRQGGPLRFNQWRKAYFDPAVLRAGLADVTRHDLRVAYDKWGR
ncbi:hypothetical protein [Streptomyces sp. NPDC049881]|uniref:hypothetical protein n=1 Tax=Streptomyces sp. NPDC049881 TaxID=3155778 RepID=UPI0034234902